MLRRSCDGRFGREHELASNMSLLASLLGSARFVERVHVGEDRDKNTTIEQSTDRFELGL